MKSQSILLVFLVFLLLSAGNPNEEFPSLCDTFEKEYQQLNMAGLQLSYKGNINAIPTGKERNRQLNFFQKYYKALQEIEISNLQEEDQLSHAVLTYEVSLNIERLDLEEQWKSNNFELKGDRLHDEAMGKKWYAYYLKRWVDAEITPDWAFQFGLEEIEKVEKNMSRIRNRMGMDETTLQKYLLDSTYFLASNEEIEEHYDALRVAVREKAQKYFPNIDKIIPVYIEAGTSEEMDIAPAYYDDNTFYYNHFNKAYDKRDMGWIFLHEAIPGHHYQNRLNTQQVPTVRNLFWYSGNAEGWAAYIEQYGRQLGAYVEPMDAYAQLQWDLIRSVRVSLDVGLNYYGWTDAKAMEFWKEHIPNKEDIGQREIKRMKRWPAQVITYKYGKHVLDELKGEKKSPQELKEFHTQVLEFGSIPLSILKQFMLKKQSLRAK